MSKIFIAKCTRCDHTVEGEMADIGAGIQAHKDELGPEHSMVMSAFTVTPYSHCPFCKREGKTMEDLHSFVSTYFECGSNQGHTAMVKGEDSFSRSRACEIICDLEEQLDEAKSSA